MVVCLRTSIDLHDGFALVIQRPRFSIHINGLIQFDQLRLGPWILLDQSPFHRTSKVLLVVLGKHTLCLSEFRSSEREPGIFVLLHFLQLNGEDHPCGEVSHMRTPQGSSFRSGIGIFALRVVPSPCVCASRRAGTFALCCWDPRVSQSRPASASNGTSQLRVSFPRIRLALFRSISIPLTILASDAAAVMAVPTLGTSASVGLLSSDSSLHACVLVSTERLRLLRSSLEPTRSFLPSFSPFLFATRAQHVQFATRFLPAFRGPLLVTPRSACTPNEQIHPFRTPPFARTILPNGLPPQQLHPRRKPRDGDNPSMRGKQDPLLSERYRKSCSF